MELQPSSIQTAPRGVIPEILIQQVKNTAPFIFEADFEARFPSEERRYEYLKILRETARESAGKEFDHVEYFVLCLAAHHGTVATFVPTDVDNQIRFKLWHPSLPTETLVAMADAVLRSLIWDYRPVSTRWVESKLHPESRISGHDGEWLSTAVGAYAALRKRAPEKAAEIGGAIVRELQKEADLFEEFKRSRNGVALLKAVAMIAHNLGDLDRVFEMWSIPAEDELKMAVYKTGHLDDGDPGRKESRFNGSLYAAGKLYKEYMAIECHRHFALRAARPLRKCSDLLLPIGPFFDEWGKRVAAHPGLSLEEKGIIAEALIDGWERLIKNGIGPVGYARGLAGILETFPGGFQRLSQYLPAKLSRTLKAGPLRSLCTVPRQRFEDQWSQMALRHLN